MDRNSSEWPVAVYEKLVSLLRRGDVGNPTETEVVATWLNNTDVFVVFKRNGGNECYGISFNTKDCPTGTVWPEPESIASEIAAYCVFESLGAAAPPEPAALPNINWVLEQSHEGLPQTVGQLSSDSRWY
ncbi:hypothetical protein IEU95_10625 [Hoyosella rhizosphaerae]|uniref:Uncharacterized protein n=1 Tax=Hoyosella rhizosphaerae TaxID=1755582 RepID=A0A916X8P0_9ACTN|nr:hypothetical protein [Hoyosella rhizosphaerae]MBN4927289.1 hypothetical protein [Hoyosella rhizosphaerae]GGC52441.1 hypothetical protein GCM10011410_00970 [Hoyosella rhizosphaerae]